MRSRWLRRLWRSASAAARVISQRILLSERHNETESFLYYLDQFGELMNDLRVNIIAIALFAVAFNFIQFAIENPEATSNPRYWLRVALLFFAVTFTSYDVIAFKLYARSKINRHSCGYTRVSEFKVSALFITELLMLAINAWIVAIPTVSIKNALSEPNSTSLYYLFLILSIWHLINIIWYLIDFTGFRDITRHSAYMFINIFLFFTFFFVSRHAVSLNLKAFWFEVSIISTHGLVMLSIYLIQVKFFIQSHIKTLNPNSN